MITCKKNQNVYLFDCKKFLQKKGKIVFERIHIVAANKRIDIPEKWKKQLNSRHDEEFILARQENE